MTAALDILAPGACTTVQDLGRVGHRAVGVPVSGALDRPALRLANALVGNPQAAAALEVRLTGPTLRVAADRLALALTGTGAALEILEPERRLIPPNTAAVLTRDQVVRVGAMTDSACAYLAVGGGFDLPPVYGSLSTYAPGGFGGLHGRPLAAGDRLPLVPAPPPRAQTVRRPPVRPSPGPIRVVLGPQNDHFTSAAIARFLSSTYTVSPQTDRMGMRLDGPVLAHARGADIASDGVVGGAVQVPGNGLPIVLLADCQTTGGYPKIATAISADLPALGRALPGTTVRFEAVDVATAEGLARTAETELRASIASIAEAADLETALRRENLISGVVFDP